MQSSPQVTFSCTQGCEPDVKDRDECSPLYCAAAWNRAEAVKCLENMGCPSWIRSTDQRTAVHVAAEQGWTDLLDLLVRQLKNKVCLLLL
jgi:ankyrin repeat protein